MVHNDGNLILTQKKSEEQREEGRRGNKRQKVKIRREKGEEKKKQCICMYARHTWRCNYSLQQNN